MHDPALEPFDTDELRLVAGVVAVVPGAGVEEAGGQRDRCAVVDGVHGPASVHSGPLRAGHLVPEADPLVDARVRGGVADIPQDRRPVRDRLRLRPRAEPVPEGVHVRVRPHAGVAEQVPRAADRVARFEDRVAAVGERGLDVVCRTDSGQAGADDEDIDVFGHDRRRRISRPSTA